MTFHWRHRWVAASVDQMHRTPTGLQRGKPAGWKPVTLILTRCPGCRQARTEELSGHWTLQDLIGQPGSSS